MIKVGYIGNYYKIPEYLVHSSFNLCFVIIENGCLSNEMMTFLKVRDIPYYELVNKEEIVDIINKVETDLWITCSYGKRIPIERIPMVEIYNIHYAALPYYKGRHPTFYATVCNEKEIGISLHQVTSNIDEGKIITREIVPYYLWEDENDLFEKLTKKIPLLIESLYQYIQGTNTIIIENAEGYYYKPVTMDDITIDIDEDTPAEIFNKVRAQAKYNGALLNYCGKEYWVRRVIFSKNSLQEGICVKKEDYYVVFYTQ